MAEFKFIKQKISKAYHNLATEEYLLKQTDGFYVYIWVNVPSVIVGVNQNTVEEVNLAYTKAHNIKVVRRLTGGGAVYHDSNNICYTIIAPYEESENTYKKFSIPVIEYLATLGVKAEFSGRNDILIDGKKISGTAQTVYKDRIMHHGTLLFDSNLTVLTNALKENKLKIESKGIKSNRARVMNVKEALSMNISFMEFFDGLCDYLSKGLTPYELTEEDNKKIEKLVREKYSTDEWNIGYSPKSQNSFKAKFPFGIFAIDFDLNNGYMQNVKITGDFFCKKDINDFASSINGTFFNHESVVKAFSSLGDYIVNANGQVIAEQLFE